MTRFRSVVAAATIAAGACLGSGAPAQDLLNPVTGDFTLEDFEFHDGTVLAEVNVHYATIGDPENDAVIILHGTAGSHKKMLREGFAGALFGDGQPLDASTHYLIFPDTLGTGGSTKPSDGMRMTFPHYNYDDMVEAQYRLVTEGLGLSHVRGVIGNSMGGMQAWLWAINYPDFMDAIVPMAASPAPMAGRNWIMRRMIIDSIKTDPAWNNGNYIEQPPNLARARVWFRMATSGGEQSLYKKTSTNADAEAFLNHQLANATAGDANDTLYQWEASRDFDPSNDLDKIKAHVLVINSEDDERNPPELGILEKMMPKVENGRVFLIPASEETAGHATTGTKAHLYADALGDFWDTLPFQKR